MNRDVCEHGNPEPCDECEEGVFDNVPLANRERDRAFEAFIKRKDVKAMFSDGFPFPSESWVLRLLVHRLGQGVGQGVQDWLGRKG